MRLTDDPLLDDLPYDKQVAFARNMRCPTCGRKGGQKCLAMNGNRNPVDVNYCHVSRMNMARAQYRIYAARRHKA